MRRIDFQVTRANHRWNVKCGTEVHGPYYSRHDALADAIDAAQTAGLEGSEAVVTIHNPGKEPELAWRYGVDRHPDEDPV